MPARTEFEHFPSSPRYGDNFGARMRDERERRNISIASIADSTKILGALLEGLERNDLSRWPSGLYRRAFMRAYASAIGLDPDAVVREFVERFPDPDEHTCAPALPRAVVGGTMLRLTLADTRPWFSRGRVIRRIPRRCAAVAFDATMLGAVNVSLFVAFGALWAPLSVSALSYYFVSILVLGNTPGVCLFASRDGGNSGGKTWSRLRGLLSKLSDYNELKILGVPIED